MNISFINIVIVAALVAVAYGKESPVEQCEGQNFEDLKDRIEVIPCGAKDCKLARLTNITVIFKFKTKKSVPDLINDVSAQLDGLPLNLPFIGVTGESACGQVYYADTNEHAHCPLEAGHEYVYKNVFYIHDVYPLTKLRVHWSLKDGSEDVICFEVPARITRAHTKKTKSIKP